MWAGGRGAGRWGNHLLFVACLLSEVQQIAERAGIIRQGVVVEVAETETLINRSLRRVYLRFRQPVEIEKLTAIPGVTVLSQGDGPTAWRCRWRARWMR